MSSADFANFGATALNLAGTAYIVGQTTKMLRGAQRQARPIKVKHSNKKIKHVTHEPHRTGHTSKGDDYGFDFRL